MEKFETMKHYLRNKGIEIDEETIEDVKDYVNNNLMEKKNEYKKELTDTDYLVLYIQDMAYCALQDDRFDDMVEWSNRLNEVVYGK